MIVSRIFDFRKWSFLGHNILWFPFHFFRFSLLLLRVSRDFVLWKSSKFQYHYTKRQQWKWTAIRSEWARGRRCSRRLNLPNRSGKVEIRLSQKRFLGQVKWDSKSEKVNSVSNLGFRFFIFSTNSITFCRPRGMTTWPVWWRRWRKRGASSRTRRETCCRWPTRTSSGLADPPGGWSPRSNTRPKGSRRSRDSPRSTGRRSSKSSTTSARKSSWVGG